MNYSKPGTGRRKCWLVAAVAGSWMLALQIAAVWAQTPAREPRRAQIPDRMFKLSDFGARGDGTTMNTGAIQAAVTACAQRPPNAAWQPAQPPQTDDLGILREAAAGCRSCPLYQNTTQTVFGESSLEARVVFVGEQPGDLEDLEGRPFIGPAGQLLDRALAEAGIDREQIYLTNAVKHFKWEPRGKRRLHQKPNSRDIEACRPWLVAELGLLRPRVLIALGGTAAQTLLGPGVRVLEERGKIFESEFCAQTIVTVHPSSLLRAPDEAARAEAYALFLRDLRLIAPVISAR